ncbi:MAG: hypothetical protein ACOCP8_05810 [archaeon]
MFGFLKRKIGLSKDRKYKVGNKLFTIIDDTNSKAINYLLDITINKIIKWTKKEKIFSKFNHLKIILSSKDYQKGRTRYVKGKVIFPDIIMIYVDPIINIDIKDINDYKEKFNTKEYTAELKKVLIHETYHLIHYKKNKAFEKRYKIDESNLDLLSKREFETKSEEINLILIRLKDILKFFITRTWAEGISEFYEELYNGKLYFNAEEFNKLYKRSRNSINFFQDEFFKIRKVFKQSKDDDLKRQLIKLRNLISELTGLSSYTIGKHIFYSIKYLAPQMNDEEILKQDIKSVILLYEELMESNNYKPIISLYSNKGLFDYKESLMVIIIEFRKRFNLI